MPLIQHIQLEWEKPCRGAPYSGTRNKMDKCYILPKIFYAYNPIGYPAHYIYFHQTVNGIQEVSNRILRLSEINNIRVGALELIKENMNYQIRYRYDYLTHAKPVRGSYDKSGTYVYLNETAMILKPNEYGRITYNGRYVDIDFGFWYYLFDIINVINTCEQMPLDIFTYRTPDKCYDQIAFLK